MLWNQNTFVPSVSSLPVHNIVRQVTGPSSSGSNDATLRKSCARVEKIEGLLDGERSLLDRPQCKPCAAEIVWKVTKRLRYVNSCSTKYEDALHATTVQLEVPQQSRSVNVYLASADIDQLQAATFDMETEISKMQEDEAVLSSTLTALRREEASLTMDAAQLEGESQATAYAAASHDRERSILLRLLDASAREINYLRRTNTVAAARSGSAPPLFRLQPAFDQICIEPGSYGLINGQRLAYRALGRCNLNWTELNFAWAILTAWLRCARNSAGLPQCVDFSVLGGSQMQQHFLGTELGCLPAVREQSYNRYAVRLRPLRDRALLLVERQHTEADMSTAQDRPTGYCESPRRLMNSSARANSAAGALPPRPTPTSPRDSHRYVRASGDGPEPGVGPRGNDALPAGLPCGKEEWTLHLEGGVQSQAAEVEYKEAVQVVCAAACATVLEAHFSAHHCNAPPVAREAAIDGKVEGIAERGEVDPTGVEGWWLRLEQLLAGRMQHVALALLLLGDQLVLSPGPLQSSANKVADPRRSSHTGTAAANSPGKSGASQLVSSQQLASPPTGILGFFGAASSSVLSPRTNQDKDKVFDSWDGRLRALVQLRSRGEAVSLLSCLEVCAGPQSQSVPELMDGLVLDLLATLRRQSL
jgi:hypothetical protein